MTIIKKSFKHPQSSEATFQCGKISQILQPSPLQTIGKVTGPLQLDSDGNPELLYSNGEVCPSGGSYSTRITFLCDRDTPVSCSNCQIIIIFCWNFDSSLDFWIFCFCGRFWFKLCKKIEVFKFEYLILTTKTPGFSFRVYRIWSWWMGASTKCPGTQTEPACHLILSLSSAVRYLILTPDSCTISPLWPSPRSTIRLAWFSTEILFQDLILEDGILLCPHRLCTFSQIIFTQWKNCSVH